MAFDTTQEQILGQSTFMSFTNSQLILVSAHEVINPSWAGIRVILTSVLLSKRFGQTNPRFGCHTPNLLMVQWQRDLFCRKIVQVISSGVSLGKHLSWNSTLVLHCLFVFPIDAHLWNMLLNNHSLASSCIPHGDQILCSCVTNSVQIGSCNASLRSDSKHKEIWDRWFCHWGS